MRAQLTQARSKTQAVSPCLSHDLDPWYSVVVVVVVELGGASEEYKAVFFF